MGKIVNELSQRADYLVTLFSTDPGKTPHDLVPLLKPPIDLVIAAGGDGTIRFTVAALAEAGSKIPAGIIPLGTLNVLARNLGIVQESFFANPLANAFSAIQHGRPMRIDLGTMNGEYFVVAAGAGPISDAFVVPSREEKNNFRMLAYARAAIQSISVPPVVFKITTNDSEYMVESSGVFVSNVEDFGLGKAADIGELSDGELTLNILNPKDFRDYVEIGFRYAGGFVDGNAPCYVRKVREVRIEVVPGREQLSALQEPGYGLKAMLNGNSQRALPAPGDVTAMIDGEQWGTTPMHVRVIPKAVNILVPPRPEELEFERSFSRSLPYDMSLPKR